MTAVSARALPVRRGWFVIPALAGALVGAYALWLHVTSDPLADVHAYYDAATRLNAGLPLYRSGGAEDYLYPPLVAILFRPLALLPFEVAAGIWEALLLAAFATTLWRLGIRRPATWLAAGILGVAIGWALGIGQAEAILTLLLTVGSPLSVALAGSVKLFPFLVGLYWLARRDWRTLGRFVSWTVGLSLLQLVVDPADTLAYPGAISLRQLGSIGNVSPFVLSPLLWAFLLVVGVGVTIRLGRTRWGWGAAVALSVFASPRLFVYMLMSLLACLRRDDNVPPPV
jgi:Glycosyltransferase family 87